MFSLFHFLALALKGKLGLNALASGPFALMAGPGSGDGFQSFVNNALPPGVAGDFAGANIRANVVAGSFAYTATPAGVVVGVGGWANPTTKQVSNYYQSGAFPGFVHREGQAVITTFLGVSTVTILQGMAVTLMDQGDFWGIFASGATVGQKVYFDPLTGALTSNATGNGVKGTNTAGASIASNVLTTTDADQSGSALAVGQIITGPGIPAGTYILSANGTGSGTHLWNLANLDGTAIADIAGPITINNWGVAGHRRRHVHRLAGRARRAVRVRHPDRRLGPHRHDPARPVALGHRPAGKRERAGARTADRHHRQHRHLPHEQPVLRDRQHRFVGRDAGQARAHLQLALTDAGPHRPSPE